MKEQSKMFRITPLGDRVIVRPDEREGEKKLASGIILPEAADKEKLMTGTVVAVGPGKRDEDGERMPLDVQKGDSVFFKKPWDEPVKIEGIEYYVLSESDLIGISH